MKGKDLEVVKFRSIACDIFSMEQTPSGLSAVPNVFRRDPSTGRMRKETGQMFSISSNIDIVTDAEEKDPTNLAQDPLPEGN